jgi:hypothetical protein
MGLIMSEHVDPFTHIAGESAAGVIPGALDWRKLADHRLDRLVELEHDHSVMCDRLSRLQVDYRESLVAGVDQLQRIQELDRSREQLQDRLADLAQACARMRVDYENAQAALLGSRSWRLTRPLRAVSIGFGAGRRRLGRLLRTILRVPLLRRVARLAMRQMPGVHARLRARFNPHG